MKKPVEIKAGPSVAAAAEALAAWREAYLVFDAKVAPLAARLVAAAPQIRASLGIDVSEEDKTMETVLQLCRFLTEVNASRKALVVALGGGITCDVAGFAAAIYRRGVDFVLIPTTLLAQVDAAIGGKTGVNLDGYKNMLGAFRQPVFTWLCPEPLGTLGAREWRSGAAELLKTFLIGDAGLYREAVEVVGGGDSFASLGMTEMAPGMTSLITRAAGIKADIVDRDPFEQGERRVLNLGHSFAHALEYEAARRGDDLTHGEAVAIGIQLAARLSERLGVAENGLAVQLKRDFEACGLPTSCPYPIETLENALSRDKKTENERIHFILIAQAGRVVEQDLSAAEAIQALL